MRVEGRADHPVTRGGLCAKTKDFAEHHYNADRVLYPLKRYGPKGTSSFVRISWEEALAEIKKRWDHIIAEHGPEAIYPVSYLGNQGMVHGLNVGDAFFNRLGSTVCEKTYCGSGGNTAWLLTVGATNGLDPESFAHAKFIIIWGCNTLSTNLHHWPFVLEARRKGAKVVVIDPFKSRTAKQADWHIAPRAGTDGALAMAMIHCFIAEGLIDDEYVTKHTIGFPEMAAAASACTPEWAEGITGVAAQDIRTLAREYAGTESAAIRVGISLERSAGGTQAIRAITVLPALTGAWRHVAGGIYQAPAWETPVKLQQMCRPDWIKPGTRVVNLLRLGEALAGDLALDPPIRSLFVYNTNPVTQAMDTNKLITGLKRDDLFTVVADHFITDTASFADIILPPTMAAEQDDIVPSWGHFYVTLSQRAVQPPGETASNAEIFRRLARTMGFDEPEFGLSDTEMIEAYLDWDAPQMAGITIASLRQHGFGRLDLGLPAERAPHRDGNFKTPSGKCEILVAGATDFVVPAFRQMYEGLQGTDKVPTLPSYVPPYGLQFARTDGKKEPFPLTIVAPKSHGFLNSQYANEPRKIAAQGQLYLMINTVDAVERSIVTGDRVRVFNEQGTFQADAKVTSEVTPGLLISPVGYWQKNNPLGTVNSVSALRFGGLGRCPTFSDNQVQVERVSA